MSDTTPRLLRLKQVLQLVPFSKSHLYELVKKGTFPRPVKLSERVTCWYERDIKDYIEKTAA